ncbi:hypothetical protein ACJMK2_007323 [Sinanodonta woodiana]|uniref:Heat shock 70 kDa protein 12A n=1 Tax=Sinanodonta woodiana TaxID=1069815 RepID=A0ABD3VLD2_SINWO
MAEWTPKLVVAAIDFGTTCTGYAYSLTENYKNRRLNIMNEQLWPGRSAIGGQAPTSILFNQDQTFHSFGFEAEKKYKDLALFNKEKEWYFFKHFKMILHHTENLTLETDLESANKRSMKAIVVFTAALKYVADHVYETIKHAHGNVSKSNIMWVLTVPAIWRDTAKMFMRKAAEEADIKGDQLLLAVEPEAAAIYCKEQAIIIEDKDGDKVLKHFNPGEQYLVGDLGGGTVDVTVHEVTIDGKLKELRAASGGPWGGTTVNNEFWKSIEDAVGTKTFAEFRLEDQLGWIELDQEFEKEKRSYDPNKEGIHTLRIPPFFINRSKLYGADIICKKHDNSIAVMQNHFVIHATKMKEYFDTAIDKITDHISKLLQKKKLSKVSLILLVGGFAESRVVQNKLRNYFKAKHVFVPPEASGSVLKGAVMFAHNPNIIAERISPWTYGVHTRKVFNKKVHDSGRKLTIGGKEYVNKAFDKYLEIGQSVVVGEDSPCHIYRLINSRDHLAFWKVYKSEKKDPLYCDDKGVDHIGDLVVKLPADKGERNWKLELRMTCRGTELEARVRATDTEYQFEEKTTLKFLRSDFDYELVPGDVFNE